MKWTMYTPNQSEKDNEVIVYRVMMYANQRGYSVQSDDVR